MKDKFNHYRGHCDGVVKKKLVYYGGDGIACARKNGIYEVHGDGKTVVFDDIDAAAEYYDALFCDKALWDVTGAPELLECHELKDA